jgi:opine dehydrogenase
VEIIERILVMGSGPAGLANAAALSRRGYAVTLYDPPDYSSNIGVIKQRRRIEIEGSFGEESVRLPLITSSIQEAFHDIQLILITVPAFVQRLMVERCIPHLKPGHVLLLMPGSAGSLEAATILHKTNISLDEVLLGESASLPQASRRIGEERIRITLSARLRIAAFPGRNTPRLVDAIGETLALIPKPNVLDPGLNNPNFIIHPGPMLLNYADVERTDGYLSLMNEGMTEGVLRLLDAVDAEKMSLQQALGLEVVDIDTLYREKGSGPYVYREKGEPFGLRDRIWDRYIEEDVPYGTVLFSSLGDLLGVDTPVCDAINTILSVVKQKNYWEIGRTLDKMGIAGMSRDVLLRYLMIGEKN